MNTNDLSIEVALVTGAGRGIGRLMARALSRAGATVALMARSTVELADTAAGADPTGRMLVLPGVRDPAAVRHVVEETERVLGPVTLPVNNSMHGGAGRPGLGRAGHRVVGVHRDCRTWCLSSPRASHYPAGSSESVFSR